MRFEAVVRGELKMKHLIYNYQTGDLRKYNTYNNVWGVYGVLMTPLLTPSGSDQIPVHLDPQIQKNRFCRFVPLYQDRL